MSKVQDFLDTLTPPDMTQYAFVVMLHEIFEKCGGDVERLLEIEKAARVCQEINDSGERYNHPNADGAQAFANLCTLVDEER